MGGNRKKKGTPTTVGKSKRGKGKRRNPLGGIAGMIVPAVSKEAGKLLKEVIPSLLAFPTSGASAMASPNLALGGYGSSMALSAPAANGTYVKHAKANMRSTKSGMNIRHREYVQDIVFGEPGEYVNVVAAPINPGNRELFPWLAGIAGRFETYRFNSLRFIYEPQCGTDNEGTVMLAVDFDAVDLPPVDKLQLMTYDGAIRSPPWFAGVYECASYNLHKYKEYFITNSLTTPTSTDEKTYFVGNIFVATQSQSASFTAGELYVEYDITLMTPQLSSIAYVDGLYVEGVRNTSGVYSETLRAGELDVMFEGEDLANNTFVIPTPGGWNVTVTLTTTSGTSLTTTVSTEIPPAGFSVASLYPVEFIEGQSSFSFYSGMVMNLTGPTWFKILSSIDSPNVTYITLSILPIDVSILRALGPLGDPVINPRPGRLATFLRKRELMAKPCNSKQLLLGSNTSQDEKCKTLSSTTSKARTCPRNLVVPLKSALTKLT